MSKEVQVLPPAPKELAAQVAPLIKHVQQFCGATLAVRVTSMASKEHALELGTKLNDGKKQILEAAKAFKEPYAKVVKEVDAYTKAILAPVEPALLHVKGQIAAFALEEERRNQEKIRKLELEKRQREEAEAKRLAEIEAKHAKEMAKVKADAKREAANAHAKERKLIQENARLEQQRLEHEREKAQERTRIAAEAKQKEIEKEQKELANRKPEATRQRWTFEVAEPAKVPRDYLIVDDSAIRNAINQGVRVIPGINIFQERSVVLA